MDTIRTVSEKLLSGEFSTAEVHPFTPLMQVEEVASGVAFVHGLANVSVIRSGSQGRPSLTLVDAGSPFFAQAVHGLIRSYDRAPVTTCVFTHGHLDHVGGLGPFEAEAPLWVVAHEAVPARFARYAKTAGYNSCINSRQFQLPIKWPTEYRKPDQIYRDHLTVLLGTGDGAEPLELHHGKGETDDHTWCYLKSQRVLFTGDLFIWACPNAGNPQKVQRYPAEWAAALRQMATLSAEVLCPGHGPPIWGAAMVERALVETAELLESLVNQTLALLNQGAPLAAILESVKAPPALLERPYLRPIYDEPEFIVRNLYRLYGGWYDGNPAHLKPPSEVAYAREVVGLCGGVERLIERAEALCATGEEADMRLSCQLIELAHHAGSDAETTRLQRVAAKIYRLRAERESSLMSKGIFQWAAARFGGG